MLILATVPCRAQNPFEPYKSAWKEDAGFFLEPNRFSVTKELTDRSLWLTVGFGRSLAIINNRFAVGLEGMAWSRLRTLPEFRFPVETLDYFFGTFLEWRNYQVGWRLRISHISSHDVDGKDSVSGGSSSRYSREFVELTRECPWGHNDDILWDVGLRVYFHQVTRIEPWIAVPACLSWTFARVQPFYFEYVPVGGYEYAFATFISSGDGPVWPSVAGGLRVDRTASQLGRLGLQLYYYYGASWAGTDAGAKVSQLKLQLDVRGL